MPIGKAYSSPPPLVEGCRGLRNEARDTSRPAIMQQGILLQEVAWGWLISVAEDLGSPTQTIDIRARDQWVLAHRAHQVSHRVVETTED